MPNPKRFARLKVGDKVFVRWQERRLSLNEPRITEEVITKVGRKYGYFLTYHECKFRLDDGISEHGDYNARANGYGFDVFESMDEIHRLKEAEKNRKRFQELVSGRYYGINPNISDDHIEKMLAILEGKQ